MRFRLPVLSLLALLALVAGACGEEEKSEQGGVKRTDVSLQVVTHGQAADPFWSVVKNGVDTAAEDLGVNVEYRAPERFDMPAMRRLIDAAVAKKPDGLAVSIPDPDALTSSIRKAVDAGIPVVSLNSGDDVSDEVGAIAHVGQSERLAGVQAGQRMREEGVRNALCVNQEVGNAALDLRCEGFREGLRGQVEVLAVDLTDPTTAQSRVANALETRGDVDGILTLGPTGADPTIAALRDAGRLGDITVATFDLSPSALRAVRDGDLLFAIDQQQFLQGYLPVQMLTHFAQLGLAPANDVLTGPAFVTRENAGRVINLAQEGLR
ncbi:MAG TPA: sugar ABC transporter substrate-binding protein [Thermoleophilaceae bacterium]|nr:sugar ABC transporter substrate-binding protein [Thermoleophilaceae bacterium]